MRQREQLEDCHGIYIQETKERGKGRPLIKVGRQREAWRKRGALWAESGARCLGQAAGSNQRVTGND